MVEQLNESRSELEIIVSALLEGRSVYIGASHPSISIETVFENVRNKLYQLYKSGKLSWDEYSSKLSNLCSGHPSLDGITLAEPYPLIIQVELELKFVNG